MGEKPPFLTPAVSNHAWQEGGHHFGIIFGHRVPTSAAAISEVHFAGLFGANQPHDCILEGLGLQGVAEAEELRCPGCQGLGAKGTGQVWTVWMYPRAAWLSACG